MQVTITVRNDFHNTVARAKGLWNATIGEVWLPKSAVGAIRNKLCNNSECHCGGNLNERGKQNWSDILPQSQGVVVPRFDGGVDIELTE